VHAPLCLQSALLSSPLLLLSLLSVVCRRAVLKEIKGGRELNKISAHITYYLLISYFLNYDYSIVVIITIIHV
jgi:hypothetical protein